MTISHDANHAAQPNWRQANGVRFVYIGLLLASSVFVCADRIIREQRRYRAVVLCHQEYSSSYEDWKHKIDTIEGLLKPSSNISGRVRGGAHRFVIWVCSAAIHCLSNLRKKIQSLILSFYVRAVDVVKPSNKAFARNQVFWVSSKIRFHVIVSIHVCCKHMMDDGGRRGNVPPDSCGKASPKSDCHGIEA